MSICETFKSSFRSSWKSANRTEAANLILSVPAYTVLYIDIDNFKVYNDIYGFKNSNAMIQFLGRIIPECLSQSKYEGYFIGHIGGDDFAAIIESFDGVEEICISIISEFERGIEDFYSSEVDRNYYYID